MLSLILGAGLLYLILRKMDPGAVVAYIKGLKLSWIIGAVALYTLDMLIRSYKWRDMLKDNGITISIKDSFLAYNLGNTLNIIIPAKVGDAARSYYLKRKYGHEYSKTLPSVFLDRVFDVLGVYLVLLVSSIYVLSGVKMPAWFYNLIAAGVICLGAMFFVMQYMIKNRHKVLGIGNKIVKELLLSLMDVLEGSIKDKTKFTRLLIYTILIWLCDSMLIFMVFLAMSQFINPMTAIFGTMIATLTKVLPVTPGGIGVFEGTMVIVFSLFGFESSLIGVMSTLSHFIMNLYTLIIGVYVMITNEIKISQITREKVKD